MSYGRGAALNVCHATQQLIGLLQKREQRALHHIHDWVCELSAKLTAHVCHVCFVVTVILSFMSFPFIHSFSIHQSSVLHSFIFSRLFILSQSISHLSLIHLLFYSFIPKPIYFSFSQSVLSYQWKSLQCSALMSVYFQCLIWYLYGYIYPFLYIIPAGGETRC